MALTRSLIESTARNYCDREPLYPVEQEAIETLPAAFRSGEFGWRDAEWVVQWTGRRYLGAVPNATRREREDAFGRNSFDDVRGAIVEAATASDPATELDRLMALDGVDLPVASAFLFFTDPETCIAVGEREWAVLVDYQYLDDPYPDPPSRTEYMLYLDTCRSIADRFGCDMWTLYRACWRLGQT